MSTKHIDLSQLSSVVGDFTTKADERFLKNVDMTLASESDINDLKATIWSPVDMSKYNSSSIIPYSEFEKILDSKIYDRNILGARVTDTNNHNWRIIKVSNGYYDLWYDAICGDGVWGGFGSSDWGTTPIWRDCTIRTQMNSTKFYNKTELLPVSLKSRVIPKTVQACYLNVSGKYNSYTCSYAGYAESQDYVWILTATELGLSENYTDTYGNFNIIFDYIQNDGEKYEYFDNYTKLLPTSRSNSELRVATGIYDTTKYGSTITYSLGSSTESVYVHKYDVDNTYSRYVPAIRVA